MNVDEFKLFIADKHTSLKAIEEAGWIIESNGYYTWFLNKDSGERVSFPFWIRESISRACGNAREETQREIREAIGL